MQTESRPPELASAGRSDQTSAGVRCLTCVALDCAADMLAAAGPMRPVGMLTRVARSPRLGQIDCAILPRPPDALLRKFAAAGRCHPFGITLAFSRACAGRS